MDMLCVRWWSDAGPAVRSGVDKYIYNAESPKQGSKRFNFFRKAIHFAHLGILFIYVLLNEVPHNKIPQSLYLTTYQSDLEFSWKLRASE